MLGKVKERFTDVTWRLVQRGCVLQASVLDWSHLQMEENVGSSFQLAVDGPLQASKRISIRFDCH